MTVSLTLERIASKFKKPKSRLMKLKHMKNRIRVPIRYSNEYKFDKLVGDRRTFKKEWVRVPIIKNFVFKKTTQDWNPGMTKADTKIEPRYLVPNHVSSFCEYLKDLFCIDDKILLDIRYQKHNHSGSCNWNPSEDGFVHIVIGARSGLRASTLVHEFLHAMGQDHEYELNETHDYRSNCTMDTYSPAIVNDIFGRREVFLT